jgi:hypothetical protein
MLHAWQFDELCRKSGWDDTAMPCRLVVMQPRYCAPYCARMYGPGYRDPHSSSNDSTRIMTLPECSKWCHKTAVFILRGEGYAHRYRAARLL